MHRLVGSSWQPAGLSAKYVWVGCAQRVGAMCENSGQIHSFSHSILATASSVVKPDWLLHGLYYFFTRPFPTQINSMFSLLVFGFSTVSTCPTMTTTTYINNIVKG